MTDHLADWIAATRDLVEQAGTGELVAELTMIAAHADRAAQRIAVAGLHTRARARFVNGLLDRRVLPSDVGPDAPVLISPGSDEWVEIQTSNGWDRRSPVPGEAWWEEGDPAVLSFRVQVTARESPLPEGSELLVAPGEPSMVASADAVVVPVMAAAAMSLQETRLLADLLDRGLTPDRVLVALTRLDLVDEGDRAEVTAHVRERAARISPELRVLPSDEVWPWMRRVLDEPGDARVRHLSGRLVACLRRVESEADRGRDRVRALREQALAGAEAAAGVLGDELRCFDGLGEDVRARHNESLAWFMRERDRFRHTLVRALVRGVDSSSDPRRWWERELGERLEAELAEWDRAAGVQVRDAALTDLASLDEELSAAFGVRLGAPDRTRESAEPPPVAVDDSPARLDLRRRRLTYRMGPTGAAVLGALILPGIGPAVALSASLVGTGLAEIRLRDLVEEQREAVRSKLPPLVDRALHEHAEVVRARLDGLYGHMREEVVRLREEHRRGAATVEIPSGASHWDTVAARAAELIAVIDTASDHDTKENG